jgi:hypothetical protein
MHREQNVCPQLVVMGVLNGSLQTWHRRPASTGARPARGVPFQSVGSGTFTSISVRPGVAMVVLQIWPYARPLVGFGAGWQAR